MKTFHLAKIFPAVATTLLIGLANTGQASFVTSASELPAGVQFKIDVANSGVSSFAGKVNSDVVTVATTGLVDTGSGYANIDPIKNGLLSQLIFTPADASLFNGFSFHAQSLSTADITLYVQDNQGGSLQMLTFTVSQQNANLGPFTILSLDGETIDHVEINGDFKEVKQIDFQYATGNGSVPEPSTVIAGALLLLPFGVSTLRIMRKKFTM